MLQRPQLLPQLPISLSATVAAIGQDHSAECKAGCMSEAPNLAAQLFRAGIRVRFGDERTDEPAGARLCWTPPQRPPSNRTLHRLSHRRR